MNLILLHADDFTGGSNRARLKDRRFEHVLRVHRAKVGDELRVGVVDGQIGRARVTRVDDVELELDVMLERSPPAPLPVTLLLALPRPKTLRRILQAIAALGVKHIVLINSWRVEKSYWKSPALAPAAIERELLLGLEQGCDTMLPRVECRRLLRPFVENELAALTAGTRAFVADPGAPTPCPHQIGGPLTLAIGPEGGFIPREIETLATHHFTPISLGARPLRVEHAIVHAIASLM